MTGSVLLGIGIGAGIALAIAWRRLPLRAAVVAIAVAGIVAGAGALLVQDGVTTAEWAVTLAAFGVAVPLEAHLALSRRDT